MADDVDTVLEKSNYLLPFLLHCIQLPLLWVSLAFVLLLEQVHGGLILGLGEAQGFLIKSHILVVLVLLFALEIARNHRLAEDHGLVSEALFVGDVGEAFLLQERVQLQLIRLLKRMVLAHLFKNHAQLLVLRQRTLFLQIMDADQLGNLLIHLIDVEVAVLHIFFVQSAVQLNDIFVLAQERIELSLIGLLHRFQISVFLVEEFVGEAFQH